MNIFIIIPLLSMVICLILSDIVYHSNKRSALNKVFSIFSIVSVLWIFTGEFIYFILNNPEAAFGWYKINFTLYFIIPLLLHFAFILTGKKNLLKKKYIYFVIYLPSIFYSIIHVATDYMTGNPENFLYGNPGTSLLHTPLIYQIFILHSLILDLIVFIIIVHFYFKTGDRAKKNQIRYVLIGFFAAFILTIFLTALFILGIKVNNNISILLTVFNIFIGYGIWKHDLFKIDPVKAIENIIRTMPYFLVLADIEKKIIDINPALTGFFNYTEDEIKGKNIDILFADKKTVEKITDDLLSGEDIVDFETELLTESGKIIPVLFSGSIIKNKMGHKIGYLCIARDITERKHAEEMLISYNKKLKESNQNLQDFAHMASHDLQEPLRKINFFSEKLMTRDRSIPEEEEQDYLVRIQNASIRMQTLMEGLLSYSRITTESKPFNEVDLTHIIKEVISDLEVRIEKTQGKVELYSMPVLEGDATQMRQLFQNLIGNALKFHKPDEPPLVKIYSSVAGNKESVNITVEDNGIGIDENSFDKIFKIFQRLHGRSNYEGSGIGLAVCKKIVERHGGSIKVSSKHQTGTRFIINLPVKQPFAPEHF